MLHTYFQQTLALMGTAPEEDIRIKVLMQNSGVLELVPRSVLDVMRTTFKPANSEYFTHAQSDIVKERGEVIGQMVCIRYILTRAHRY